MVNVVQPVENQFLGGNFAPVSCEYTHEPVKIISGSIPAALHDGMYIRNGPNALDTIEKTTYHLFDGNGMLQGVYFRNGQPTYINRYVRTKKLAVQEQMEMGFPNMLGMALSTNKKTILKFMAIRLLIAFTSYKSADSNTSLVFHHKRLLTLYEGEQPKQIQAPDLETIGDYYFMNDKLKDGKHKSNVTAHPKVCPRTGNMYFFAYDLESMPHVTYSVASPEGHLKVNKKAIPQCKRPITMHDFAITEHWAILLDLPLILNPRKNIKQGKPFIALDETEKSKFHLIDRETGGNKCIMTFEHDPCVIIHTAHAYESVGTSEVILIACMSPDTNLGENMTLKEVQAHLTEFRFNLVHGTMTATRLYHESVEFPVINEVWRANPSLRYVYAARSDTTAKSPLFDGVIKHDIQSHNTQTYRFQEGFYGGEPFFVSNKNPDSEDDGYLLVFISRHSSAYDNFGKLLVLDAKTLEDVCILEVPARIPFGFHGTWVNESQIESQIKHVKRQVIQPMGWRDWVVYKAIDLVNWL